MIGDGRETERPWEDMSERDGSCSCKASVAFLCLTDRLWEWRQSVLEICSQNTTQQGTISNVCKHNSVLYTTPCTALSDVEEDVQSVQ